MEGKINSTSTAEGDVKRIDLASDVAQRLKIILEAKYVRLATKVKIYETLVLSTLCYNAETWTLTTELQRKLRVFEMSCPRRIAVWITTGMMTL